MIEKNNTQKVLAHFFTNPTKEIHLRELSRQMKLSMPAIISATKKLRKEKLIIVTKGRALTTIKSSNIIKFTRLKKLHNLELLYTTGLVDALVSSYNIPHTIICFGSYSRGEDTEESDIDIAIIGGRTSEITLDKFEKQLNRIISIHKIDLNKISEEFRANLYNGIILEGYL